MAEAYLRQGVLDHLHLDARVLDDPGNAGVLLCERRFVGKLNLRGDGKKKFRETAAEALGFEPPSKPNTTAGAGGRVALWLGPDEWLVTTPPGEEAETADALRAAFGDRHVVVTDVTDGRAVIGLAGAGARDVLTMGCPLDLHPRAFAAGACAQSTLAKSLVILHCTDDAPAYDIFVERSFADYLWKWLEDAARSHGMAVVRD